MTRDRLRNPPVRWLIILTGIACLVGCAGQLPAGHRAKPWWRPSTVALSSARLNRAAGREHLVVERFDRVLLGETCVGSVTAGSATSQAVKMILQAQAEEFLSARA